MDVEMGMEKEMESEDGKEKDPRYILARALFSTKSLHCTQRSRVVAMYLRRWMKDGKDPDNNPGGNFTNDCCVLSFKLQNLIITKYYAPVLHHFRPFFPELDSLVEDPISYLRVVKKIYFGIEARNVVFSEALLMDLQQQGLFTPSMVTTVVALRSSLTHVPHLSVETLTMIKRAIERSLSLDAVRNKIDAFICARIGLLTPNLSALVGASIAAKLVGAAGGLSEISAMPLSDIMLLNSTSAVIRNDTYDDLLAKHVNCTPLFEDYTQQEQQLPDGIVRCFVGQTDIISSTHQRLKNKACHSLAEAINLAATVDLNRADVTGGKGRAMREEICRMIHKWKEEDSYALMEMRAHLDLAVRPKKNKLAVSEKCSKMFKVDLNKDKKKKPYDKERIKRREDRVLAYLQDFTVTPTDLQPSTGS